MQVAVPLDFRVSKLLLLLLADRLVLHGGGASMGSCSSVHILLDLKYIVFNHLSTLLVGRLCQIGRFLKFAKSFPKKVQIEKVFTNSDKAEGCSYY